MIALLQRVTEAAVEVNHELIAQIGPGVLAFIAVEKDDTEVQLNRLTERLLNYRLFPDTQNRMNLNVRQAGGELLLVPQFTLAANTESGNRPSFTPAADPQTGSTMFLKFAAAVTKKYPRVKTGAFGAEMQVSLVNDGPVTFWLQAR